MFHEIFVKVKLKVSLEREVSQENGFRDGKERWVGMAPLAGGKL